MDTHQVVPDVLDTVPANVTVVTYAGGQQVQLGNELTPTEVKDAPSTVQWQPADPNQLYTLIMSDPDAPAREYATLREMLHWLVVNVPGSDLSSGDTILPYVGSGPPEGTGLHRYIFVVFQQSGTIDTAPLKIAYTPQTRAKFNTRNFVAKHNLGSPISGNFYQAQFDDHVRGLRGGRLVAALAAQQVVPDVIDSAPQFTVEAKYSSGAMMMIGSELTPTSVKDIPDFVLWQADPNAFYTLCLTDPDAPSRAEPKFREFLHWLVVNIPGRDLASGQTLVEYIGSGPPLGTGLHRYVLLVYRQPGRITPDESHVSNTSREGRRSFRIRAFAAKYQLGQPVAANFYQAQYDDYVPTLHEQLSRG